MNPTFRWVALAAAVLGLGLSLAVAACGSDDDDSSAAGTTTVATTDTTTATTTDTTTSTGTTTTGTTTTGTTTTSGSGVQTFRITVVGAKPQGGIQRKTVKQGDTVALVVTSDVADEIHLHGYDLKANAAPGKDAHITFVAKVPGRFEIELEDHGVQIGDLEVEP